jgi:Sec-independent protein secretion pathway component TatC
VLYQIWRFVGVGLYPNEQRFVKMFLPASIVLFYAGVAFLFFIVLPIVIQFFVSFSLNWPAGNTEPTVIERLILGIKAEATTQPTTQSASQPATDTQGPPEGGPDGSLFPLRVQILSASPDAPETGDLWFDAKTNELFLKTEDGFFKTTLRKHTGTSALTNQFSIKDYTSFVLLLSLAFGIAFQTPIVVLFLAITDIASVQAMARSRRYVIFSTVVIGAVLTPPDVVSQVMLAIPMWFLFEGGLIAARILIKKESAKKESRTSADRR